MRLIQAYFLSTLCCVLMLPGAHAESADTSVRIDVSGLRGARGDVGCLLFATADGYPDDHGKAYRELHAPIDKAGAACIFKNVVPGTFAAIVFHDVNLSGKLEKNFLGIPQEGYGASNHFRPRFSAPGFVEASFSVAPGSVTPLNIQMGY
jgi:uncharacterized protein (DUF2141 family)